MLSPWSEIGFLLSLLPAVIVLQHVLYLRLSRKRFRGTSDQLDATVSFLKPAYEGAKRQEEIDFSNLTLLSRYGIPALLASGLGIMWSAILPAAAMRYATIQPAAPPTSNPPVAAQPAAPQKAQEPAAPTAPGAGQPASSPATDTILRGVQGVPAAAIYGFIGAYMYVVLTLGQRYFRRDITSGIVTWCAVTIAAGPVLAGILCQVWHGSTPDSTVTSAVIYVLAGLAPQFVMSFLEETATRLLQPTNGKTDAAAKPLPLVTVHGVTPAIADRLGEEGIWNVSNLANASPHRLLRNTSFDPRMILSWIDEAILIATLPQHWQKLEDNGITGAIDLVWYRLREAKDSTAEQIVPAVEIPPRPLPGGPNPPVVPVVPNPPRPNPPPAGDETSKTPPPLTRTDIQSLSRVIGIDINLLRDVIDRLFEDAQVQKIWVLYQTDSSETH